MNKKLNTLLFVLGATLFNVIVTVLVLVILGLSFLSLIYYPFMPNTDPSWAFVLIFLTSIIISIVVYRIVLKVLLKKIDLDKYFDPMFAKKYKKK